MAAASRSITDAAEAAAGSRRYAGSTLLSTTAPRWRWRSWSSAMKNSASRTGCGVERRHDDERRSVVEQDAGHGLGPFDETVVHRLEEHEEVGDVLQELRAEDAIGNAVEGPRGAVMQPGAVGRDEPAQQSTAEEVGHACRRVEKVDGVARRRGVDDDQVVAPGAVDVVQSLHRDVVVALHELRREVAGTAGWRGSRRRSRVGCVSTDEVVPRLPWCRAWRPTARRVADAGLAKACPGPASRRCRTARGRARWRAGGPDRR